MITVDIPNYKKIDLKHLVLDYNGTIAVNGVLISGVRELLDIISDRLDVHVITADTFGKIDPELTQLNVKVTVIAEKNQDQAKLDYINSLGSSKTVCIGNGSNDHLMLSDSVLGIGVIHEEGAAVKAILAADIICKDILHALRLLTSTKRLIATLRR